MLRRVNARITVGRAYIFTWCWGLMTWSSFMAKLTKTLERLIYVLINKSPVPLLSLSTQSSSAWPFLFNSISVSFVLQRLCVNYVQIQLKQCFSLFLLLLLLLLVLFEPQYFIVLLEKKEYHSSSVHFHKCRAVNFWEHFKIYLFAYW